jgi:hypothetical protein
MIQKNEHQELKYFSKYINTKCNILTTIMIKSENNQNDKLKKRIKDILLKIIKKDKDGIKKLCKEGLPDDLPFIRSLVWKINLNYLNYDTEKWDDHLIKKRAEYEDIKTAFILKMDAERKLFQEYYDLNKSSPNSNNELGNFIKFTDRNLLEEIDKDVRRTHTDLNFFFMPTDLTDRENLTNEEISEIVQKKRSNDVKTIDDIYYSKEIHKFETHADVLNRILYIYAKLNPDINYVQGMNELISPIYYIYCIHDTVLSNPEADTFWSFTYLMDDIKVLFMRSKDDSREGIFKKIDLLRLMIEIVDKEVSDHLHKYKVELSHFAFKWFILFFTQNFILPDVLRLWDTIFCEKNRFYYLFYVSLAILKLKREKILYSDFANTIINLQKIEDLEIEIILSEVFKLKKEYDKKIKKIIEQNK